MNTLIELHTINKSLIIVSCFMSMRGVETDPTITSISTLVREERMVMELTHLRYQSDQRVVLNEHQWDSV